MVKAKKIAVCIESSLFLAEILGNVTHSSRSGNIEKFEKVFAFKKYMSETVRKEVENRLKKITYLIGDVGVDPCF